MKDAALLVMAIVTAWVLISWATAPAVVSIERMRADAAVARAAALETRVALIPTPTPALCTTGYPYWQHC